MLGLPGSGLSLVVVVGGWYSSLKAGPFRVGRTKIGFPEEYYEVM